MATPPCGRRQERLYVWQSQIEFFSWTAAASDGGQSALVAQFSQSTPFKMAYHSPYKAPPHIHSPPDQGFLWNIFQRWVGDWMFGCCHCAPQWKTALFTRVDRKEEGDWLLKYFPFRLNSVWNLLLALNSENSMLWSPCITSSQFQLHVIMFTVYGSFASWFRKPFSLNAILSMFWPKKAVRLPTGVRRGFLEVSHSMHLWSKPQVHNSIGLSRPRSRTPVEPDCWRQLVPELLPTAAAVSGWYSSPLRGRL